MTGSPPRAGDERQPAPVVPDFAGRCLTRVVPGILGHLGGRAAAVPEWMPEPVLASRQVVLLVVDGLGAEQLAARRELAPALCSGVGTVLTSVAPSTTAAALTSLTTGLPPAAHGVVGYRVAVDGEVLNVLAWRIGGRDARRSLPPRRFQDSPVFGGVRVPVVSRSDYAATGFTAAHLGDAELHGWHTVAGLPVEVGRLLGAGCPFVYAYYDGIDRAAHAFGLGEHYQAELRGVDRLVEDVIDVLPPGASLAVTADHGQVEVGASLQVFDGAVMDGVSLLSGEGRFRWLHAKPGAAADVLAAAGEAFGHLAWVRSADDVIGDGWLGGEPSPEIRRRLGDVALVPFEPTAFLDPADTGEQRLVCRHGSLTPEEMFVPFVAWGGP